jgi:selenocysteine lyase/cysteine desulfurase
MRVRVVNEEDLNAIRVSFHVCNQEWEVEKLIEEIGKIC